MQKICCSAYAPRPIVRSNFAMLVFQLVTLCSSSIVKCIKKVKCEMLTCVVAVEGPFSVEVL